MLAGLLQAALGVTVAPSNRASFVAMQTFGPARVGVSSPALSRRSVSACANVRSSSRSLPNRDQSLVPRACSLPSSGRGGRVRAAVPLPESDE